MSVNGFDFDGTVHRYNYNSLDNIPPNIAPAYSASSTYAVGDYCTKDNVLYKCSTAISTAEAWNSAHWTQVQLATDVADLKDDLTQVQEEIDGFEGISEEVKQALLACFRHLAFLDEDDNYYGNLVHALYPGAVYQIDSGTNLSDKTFDTGIGAFGIDDNFTILASIKVLPISTPTTSTPHVLINNGTIGNRNILRLSFDEKNGIDYFVTNYAYGDHYQDWYTPGTVYSNAEHDVIWVMRNQNKQLKKQLYIDGTIKVDKTDDLTQYSSSVFSGNYTIGGYTLNDPAPISAVVNLFRIYDTALSASEINSILNVDFSD